MELLIVGIGVLILLFLIMKVKLNTFVSLIIVSILVAIGLGMPLTQIITTIEEGLVVNSVILLWFLGLEQF